MGVFDSEWDVADRLPLVSRRVTRRRFLGMAALAGISGYFATMGLSVPEEFQVETVESPQPTFDPSSYRLLVDGLVENPLSFTYQELLSLSPTRQRCDFLCIDGWGVNDVPWEGVQLSTVMTMAQPLVQAQFVTFHSLGGTYLESLSLAQAELPSALLAYCMYGKRLPPEHGSPLRLVYPRMRGYKGAKWVTRVEFTAERDVGYWSSRHGLPVDPWVQDEQPCSGSFEGPSCAAVGGVADYPSLAPKSTADRRGASRRVPVALTGLAAGGTLLVSASTWWAARRLRQPENREGNIR